MCVCMCYFIITVTLQIQVQTMDELNSWPQIAPVFSSFCYFVFKLLDTLMINFSSYSCFCWRYTPFLKYLQHCSLSILPITKCSQTNHMELVLRSLYGMKPQTKAFDKDAVFHQSFLILILTMLWESWLTLQNFIHIILTEPISFWWCFF